MPILEINGQKVEVGDDFMALSPEAQGHAVDEIAASIGITTQQPPEQQAAPSDQSNVAAKGDLGQPEQVSTTEDVVRSLGTGLRSGAEGIVGIGGDARELGGALVDFVVGKLGGDDETRATARKIAETFSPLANAPTTEDVRSFTDPIIGEARTPQTTAGEFARTIGEFAPAAVAGPGGLARKAALAVAPAVASEAAGQATKGTAAEPFARLTGAIAGGAVASIRTGANAALKDVPSFEQVKATTNKVYDVLRNAGVTYDPTEYGIFVNKLARDVHGRGFRQGTTPKSFSIVNEMIDTIGTTPDFSDLDSLRKAAGNIMRNDVDATERELARRVIEHIDRFEVRSPIVSNGGVDTAEFSRLRREVRELASRKIKAEKVMTAIELGSTRASGADAGIRNELRKLIEPKNARKNHFTKEEVRAIVEAAQGTLTRNAARHLGSFGVDVGRLGNKATLIPGLAAGGSVAAGEPVTGAALVGLGTIAKFASRESTRKSAERAVSTVLTGKKGQRQIAQTRRLDNLRSNIRRLIPVDPAVRTSLAPANEQVGTPNR